MSKKNDRKPTSKPIPKPQTDARREDAARAVKALRSAETMKFRQDLLKVYNQDLLKVYNQEVIHNEQVRTHKRRPAPGQSVPQQIPRRQLPNPAQLRRQRLSPQVRDILQDGVRTLACRDRRTRRETLFALRKTGKNGKGNRKARWTEKSYLRCK